MSAGSGCYLDFRSSESGKRSFVGFWVAFGNETVRASSDIYWKIES